MKEEKKNRKDAALEQLKNFIRKASEIPDPEFIPTGHFKLDFAIKYGEDCESVDLETFQYDPKKPGGLPLGYLVELYGPEGSGKSSVAYRTVGSAQKLGLKCLWIDCEHSYMRNLAQLNGVDTSNLDISNADDIEDADHVYSAEQIMENICRACDAGYKVIVLDSVANLMTQAELDNPLGEGGVGMGALASVMSKAVKKVAQHANQNGSLVIMINQVREKIGQMFGCFSQDTLVRFADGTTKSIKEVVEKKLQGPVLTYDQETKSFKTAPITDWHVNGKLADDESWIRFLCEGPGTKNGRLGFHCTANHMLFNSSGEEIAAEDVIVGDELMTYREEKVLLDPVHRDIIYGSLLGDGHIRVRAENSACLSFANSDPQQQEYVQWKIKTLQMLNFKKAESLGRLRWDSNYSVELKTIKDEFYIDNSGYRQIPEDLILTDLMLAVWYQDDGSLLHPNRNESKANISIGRIKNNPAQIDMLVKLFYKWDSNLTDKIEYHPERRRLEFNNEATQILMDRIVKYIHPTMVYKLRNDAPYKKEYLGIKSQICDPKLIAYPTKVLLKEKGSPRVHRNITKYDISIGGKGTYLVGGSTGIVVHNSPETTPGGKALKFNASLRLRVQRAFGKEALVTVQNDNGKDIVIAGKSYAQIAKNRFAKPVQDSITINVYYANYFPDIEEILFDTGRNLKVIKVRTGVYSWGDIKVEGRNNFIAAIKEQKLQALLADELKKFGKEQGIMVPPEVTQYDPNQDKTNDGVQKPIRRRRAAEVVESVVESVEG